MSLNHIANHLASKGRNGDSTLVHMTNREVAGLQALARANGTTLTVNPHTGLPEAFSLKSLLPLAAGFALGPAGFGLAASAMEAGLMVGGATALATGDLKKGLMAGLGAYGGAGLGGAGAAAGSTTAGEGAVAGEGATAGSTTATQAPVVDATPTPVETINAGGSAAPATQQYAGAYQPTSFSSAPADTLTSTQAYSATPTNYGAFGEAPAPVESGTSVTDATQQQASASYGSQTTPSSAEIAAGPKPGTFGSVAANAQAHPGYLGAALAPALAEDMTPKPYQQPEIKGDADMGQRLAYNSGYDNSIPGRTSAPSYTQISNEEAKRRYGFASGGDVQDPYAWSNSGESVVRMADGGAASSGYEAGVPSGDYSGYGISGLTGNYTGYDTPVNAGISAIPSAVINAPIGASAVTAPVKGVVYDPSTHSYVGPGANAEYLGGGQWGLTAAEQAAADAAAASAPATSSDAGGGYAAGGVIPRYGFGGVLNDSITSLIEKLKAQGAFGGDSGGQFDTGTGYTYDQQSQKYTPNMASGGGISTLGGYSDGGRLLKGPGDGMSDNIPAQIGSKQPARLADGEFVVPADVVSHLGNGSTDAGAKQLYKMMDKIRVARTGRKSQGTQINPKKYLPA